MKTVDVDEALPPTMTPVVLVVIVLRPQLRRELPLRVGVNRLLESRRQRTFDCASVLSSGLHVPVIGPGARRLHGCASFGISVSGSRAQRRDARISFGSHSPAGPGSVERLDGREGASSTRRPPLRPSPCCRRIPPRSVRAVMRCLSLRSSAARSIRSLGMWHSARHLCASACMQRKSPPDNPRASVWIAASSRAAGTGCAASVSGRDGDTT